MFFTFISRKILANCAQNFDENENLLYLPVTPSKTPGFGIDAQYAHHISESLDYALYLLHINEKANKEQALKIIKKVLKYQCDDKNNILFGNWSYFSDKNIHYLPSPDIALNCRIAITLLHIYTMYPKILSPKLKQTIIEKISNSVYTFSTAYLHMNSFTLSLCIYLSIRFGALTNSAEFTSLGETILQDLYNNFIYHNSFYEYNDMNNLINQTIFLSRILKLMKSERHRNLAEVLLDKCWETFATHFHFETKQISGPFSITLSDFSSEEIHNFLYRTTGKILDLPHYDYELPCKCVCPEKYLPYFGKNTITGFSQSTVFKGTTSPIFRPSIVQSNYMKKEYTLGTFNRDYFWELKRPFIGYFSNGGTPYCFKIDVLLDFSGYASAVLHSLQHNGYALGHISFITDGGKKHINSDAPNPSAYASDLRIRFSVSGDIENLRVNYGKGSLDISCGDTNIYYRMPTYLFGDYDIKFKLFSDEKNLYFDAVIYSGEKTKIDFEALEKAIFRFSFLITSTGKHLPETFDVFENKTLVTKAVIDNLDFELQTPFCPCSQVESFIHDRQTVGNIPLEDYVTQITNQIRDIAVLENKSLKNISYFPYLSNDEETAKILGLIDNLHITSINSLSAEVEHILKLTQKTAYSPEIHKRIAIQLVITIFETVKGISYKFNDMIDRKHYNIYQKITSAVTTEAVNDEIMKLCRAIEKEAPAFSETNKNKAVSDKMLNFIKKELLNPELSLNYIADALGYSPSHLSRVFYETTGMKYTEYIQKEKINYAIKELRDNNATVKSVAKKLGYSGSNNFIRMFGKVTGMTITQYLNNE